MSKKTESIKRVQRRKKLFAIEAFGGKCQKCGYNKCPNALEFHHLGNKKEKPTYVIMRWSWEKAKKELDNCILVCANCHREIHYVELNVEIEPRDVKGNQEKLERLRLPWLKKECGYCRESFDTKRKEHKFCSDRCKGLASRKVARPTKEELKQLLNDGVAFTKLGKMFGVTDNAVRKWAKNYGLIPIGCTKMYGGRDVMEA